MSAGNNFTAISHGRFYLVLRNNGNKGPEICDYHADICWQRDRPRAIHTFHGTNGHLRDYGLVSLNTFANNSSPRTTPIENSASNPLFVSGIVLDCALSNQYISVLSRPFNTKDLYGNHESLCREVWLLNRNLDDLDGPTKRIVLKVPYYGYDGVKFSPNGKRFFLWSSPKDGAVGKMYIGRVNDGTLKRLKIIPRRLSAESLRNIKWKPDSKSLSIVWDGYLYAFPVD